MKYLLAAISILILVLVIAGGAFYLGQKNANQEKGMTTSPTPTVFQTTTSVGNTSTPTPTIKIFKTVVAGGVLSFPAYAVQLPEGWMSERVQGVDSDKLTLTKLNYKITISEAAFGGGGCLYPGDPESEMAQTFTIFTEITNPNGYIFRRGMSGPNTYTVCQKNTIDGSFGAPTIFGHISFETPGTPDKNGIVFPEVDAILASINKKI